VRPGEGLGEGGRETVADGVVGAGDVLALCVAAGSLDRDARGDGDEFVRAGVGVSLPVRDLSGDWAG
jgi:hypothetical protein